MTAADPPRGHNGGPPLDDPDPTAPRQCRWCRHWSPPSKAEDRAYEYFRLGLSRRGVRRPTGACDRVLLAPDKPLAFSATVAEFSCLNFLARPRPPADTPRRRRFVTIYEGDSVVWQGAEEDLPEPYREGGA